MSGTAFFRDTVANRLREDLVGPLEENEILSDRPTQRYSTGILYPLDSAMEAEEDQDLDLQVNVNEDSASDPDTDGVPLYCNFEALCSRAVICCGAAGKPTSS